MWPLQNQQNQNALLGPQDTSCYDPAVYPMPKKNPVLVPIHPAPAGT